MNGIRASGSATLTGGGASIGRGALTGSGRGVFTSETCITFSGSAVLRGTAGSITVSARNAQACAEATSTSRLLVHGQRGREPRHVDLCGRPRDARVPGRFNAETGTVTVSFRGRIAY